MSMLYVEELRDREGAVKREKETKTWARAKKLSLIHRKNKQQ